MWNRRWPAYAWPCAAVAILTACIAFQYLRATVYYRAAAFELFIPLEGVRQLEAGGRLHTDISTPIGALYYYVHDLAWRLVGGAGRTILTANAIVALVAASLAFAAGRRRLPPWAGSAVALFVGLVAASPRQLGESFRAATYSGMYNRYGWALICVLALVVVLPRSDALPKGRVLDGLLAGLLLFLLFYIKVTYFLVGGVLLVASLTTVRRHAPWRFALTCGAAFACLLLAMHLATGLTVPYVLDLRAAAAAQSDPLRVKQFEAMMQASSFGALLAIILAWLSRARGETLGSVAVRAAAALTVVAGGVVLGTQNHLALENPLLVIGGVIAWFSGRPDPDQSAPSQTLRHAGVLAVAGTLFLGCWLDGLACAWTVIAPRAHGAETAWFQGTPIRDVALGPDANWLKYPNADPNLSSEISWADVLHDGVSLLQRHLGPSHTERVLPFTWSNPYPTLLRLPPPRYELGWWDAERTFTARHHPDADRLLGGADLILIPSVYHDLSTSQTMAAIYAPQLARDFVVLDRSTYWTLYAHRRPPAEAGIPTP